MTTTRATWKLLRYIHEAAGMILHDKPVPDAVLYGRLTSPATAAAALRTKTTTGAYVFDTVRGPARLNQTERVRRLRVRTVTSTQVPDGVAIVMPIQGGAAVGWIRMELELMYNPYGGTTDAGV